MSFVGANIYSLWLDYIADSLEEAVIVVGEVLLEEVRTCEAEVGEEVDVDVDVVAV